MALGPLRFTNAVGGTADFIYPGPAIDMQSPASARAANGAAYLIYAQSLDMSQWEISTGAFTASSGTFARTTVIANSLGTTDKINFGNPPQVFVLDIDAPFDAEAFNNIIINGGMEVDQANAGASLSFASGSANLYQVDGWQIAKTGTMVLTGQQVADAPPGFSNSLKVTVTTAEASLAATDFVEVFQSLEGFRTSRLQFGTAGALSTTLGFWTKIHRTGPYSGSLITPSGSRSFAFSFTQNVADTWEYKTVTIPGDVAGTWVGNTNAASMALRFCVAAGSTFLGPAGAWTANNFVGVTGSTNGVAATTDVFQVTGVTLLPGTIAPTAAQSVLLKRSFDQELLLCKRYYQKSYDYAVAPGTVSNNGVTFFFVTGLASAQQAGGYAVYFAVPTRAPPTITMFSRVTGATGKIRDDANVADVTPTTDMVGMAGFRWFATMAAVGATVNFTGHWIADARL